MKTIGITKKDVLHYYTKEQKGIAILNSQALKLNVPQQNLLNFIDSFLINQLYEITVSRYNARPATFLDRFSYLFNSYQITKALVTLQRMTKTIIRFNIIALKAPENPYKKGNSFSFFFFELYNHIEPVSINILDSWKKDIEESNFLQDINENYKKNFDHVWTYKEKSTLFSKTLIDDTNKSSLSLFDIKNHKENNNGLKIITEDGKEFLFYTTNEFNIKKSMSLMGYSYSEYNIVPFENILKYTLQPKV